MAKRTSRQKTLPAKYPSIPAIEAGADRHNETRLSGREDRVPPDRFTLSDTRADLRLRVERLLRRREAASTTAWDELGPDARGLLVEMLDDETVRAEEALFHRVISVAGQLALNRAIAPLGAILSDRSARNVSRAYAANALGRIGEVAALDALVSAATVKDDMVRRQVAMALGRIKHDAVTPHLQQLQRDPSIAVAEVAREALASRKGPGAGEGSQTTRKPGKAQTSTRKKLPPADE
jgi:hypothetical protein